MCFNFSAKKCRNGMVYAYKTSACQPSCANRYPVCRGEYVEGCVCKHGTLLSGDKCVRATSCGCRFNGMYLKVIMTRQGFYLVSQPLFRSIVFHLSYYKRYYKQNVK